MAKKVLIVEDTTDIGDALKQLIELQGYQAILASTGFSGVRMAAAQQPDLILMDLLLPDMDGIDAIREIRSCSENSSTPIVCVSSYADTYEDEVLEAGGDEVLSKTAFINSFKPTLRKYLEQ